MTPNSEERQTFVVSAVHWTMKVSAEHKRGHPDLHQKLGLSFWEGELPDTCMMYPLNTI